MRWGFFLPSQQAASYWNTAQPMFRQIAPWKISISTSESECPSHTSRLIKRADDNSSLFSSFFSLINAYFSRNSKFFFNFSRQNNKLTSTRVKDTAISRNGKYLKSCFFFLMSTSSAKVNYEWQFVSASCLRDRCYCLEAQIFENSDRAKRSERSSFRPSFLLAWCFLPDEFALTLVWLQAGDGGWMVDSVRRRGNGAADEVHQLSSHSRSNEARRHFSSSNLI